MHAALIVAVSLVISIGAACASGTIGYGSRAGMQVTVKSMSGLDTAHAEIHTRHTRDDAIAFCREYVQKVTEDCIRRELDVRLNDVITANCPAGEFIDFFGTRWRLAGRNRTDSMAKYRLINLNTGDTADGSMGSGYPVAMSIFQALCPGTAPGDF
jgi:hypothetical protein